MVSLPPGSSLGRYQMVQGIGRGGMVSVFKARDPKLERYVAVKVIPSYHTEDLTFIERFRQEAQAVARLNHPNIIQVHDFGEDKGFSYIVMKLLTGGTLLEDKGQKSRSLSFWSWWPPSPRPWTTPIGRESYTGTSSPATFCSTRKASQSYPISASPV